MRLTIAIPTFDRSAALARTVAALLPQVEGDIEFLIIDNASPNFEKTALLADPRVKLFRNRVNVGAAANVLRCFEEASGDWIWVLGDDDHPRPVAVAAILAAIGDHPDALAINFNSVHGPGSQDVVTSGRIDLIERFPAFGNLLFISTNIYQRAPLVEHLHIGYRFAYSMAPHIAMLFLAAGTDGQVVFRDDVVVETETQLDGSHWSAINQALSIPTLLELPLSPGERRTLASKFQLPDLANLIIQLLGTGVRRAEFDSSKFYYRQIAGRLWPYTPLSKRCAILIGRLAFVAPRLSLRLADRVLDKRKGSSVMARLRAETIDPRS